MKKSEFVKKLKELFKTYLSKKYKGDAIPLFDAILSWGYSINSYSHMKNQYKKKISHTDESGNDWISIDDYVEITLSKRIVTRML